jgi:predicted metalloprotease with PDZ domain
MRRAAFAVLGLACCAATAALPEPQDKIYPGTIALTVDATDLDHRVVRVHETLPVAPGQLTLLIPRWIPGGHGPDGNMTQLAGLVIRAGERRLAWQRDAVEIEALHVEVPSGVRVLEIDFEHLSPFGSGGGRRTVSGDLLNLDWTTLVLYPAGHWLSAIRVKATVTIPAGFEVATSLRPVDAGPTLAFDEASLEMLIDSPIFAGRHHKAVPLDPEGASRPVVLQLFVDDPADLDAKPEMIEAHRELVRQADRLYGARHFRHYDLMLEQSKLVGQIGLEHHESSENGVKPGYFKDWGKGIKARELLPHEYTHSWNGKFRRPADLWTPNLSVPMRDSLLWVYEGQTQYWCYVLAARAGLVTAEESRDHFARTAAYRAAMAGRSWRPLQDTTSDPLMVGGGGRPWYDQQRGFDYYDEMVLVWLDVDTLIRERSGDTRSLDDFARAFFGIEDGRVAPLTYRFDDVVATLNRVLPLDWAALLRERLDHVGDAGHLLDGLARAGWKLDFEEQQSEMAKNAREEDEDSGPVADFWWSIGVNVAKEGKLDAVRWNGPAFAAGLAPGQHIVAVRGMAYTRERLEAAITAAKDSGPAIGLLMKDGEKYRTVMVDHHGGLRYPRLVRIDGVPDRLSAILTPRSH